MPKILFKYSAVCLCEKCFVCITNNGILEAMDMFGNSEISFLTWCKMNEKKRGPCATNCVCFHMHEKGFQIRLGFRYFSEKLPLSEKITLLQRELFSQ